MKIITISREFGSGGREIGKRLADILGFDYYDREILSEVAKVSNFHEDFVEEVAEKGYDSGYTLTFARTFYYSEATWSNSTRILLAENTVLKKIAEKGRDCIIVGRCADVVLKDYKPFNLFVYADMESKVARCKSRADASEELSDKKLAKKIKAIDKNRARHREVVSHIKWGDKEAYHLCVNTTDVEPKEIAPIVTTYANYYFENINK